LGESLVGRGEVGDGYASALACQAAEDVGADALGASATSPALSANSVTIYPHFFIEPPKMSA